MALEGIVVPIVTPLNREEKNRIDNDSLTNLVRHIISGGVHGIFVLGKTGEFLYLKPEEKIEAIKIISEASSIPVYVGITGKTEEETIENISAVNSLLEQGCSIDALVLAPLFYHSNRGLPQHIEELTKLTDLPFILYNNHAIAKPFYKRKNIRTHLFKRMAENPRIIAMKDSSGSFERLKNYIKAADRNCSVLQGDETAILDALRAGATGAVPSLANVYPELLVRFYNIANHPDDHPEDIQQQVIERGMVIYRQYKKTIWGIKTALVELGIIKGNRTLEPTEKTYSDEREIRKAIQYLQS